MAQLAATFGMSEANIYVWFRQERIDRGELEGLSTDQAIELAAAKRRIRQLDDLTTDLWRVSAGQLRPPDCRGL